MKVFLQEYGRGIVAAIVGSICIGICYFYITGHLFRVEENKVEKIIITAADDPILLVPDVIKIDVGDLTYDAGSNEYMAVCNKYLEFVKAYEDSEKKQECKNVSVAGIEQVDVDTPGRYRVLYKVENRDGRSFSKPVWVIVR